MNSLYLAGWSAVLVVWNLHLAYSLVGLNPYLVRSDANPRWLASKMTKL